MAQNILDVAAAQAGIDGDQNTPGGGYTKMGLQQRRNVGAEKSDAIMFLHPGCPQGGSQTIDAPGKFLVRVAALTMHNRDFVGKDQRAALYKTDRRKFSAIDFFAHAQLLAKY